MIFCPAGRRLPGAGHCSRATPLPTAFISKPDCCAISTAARNGLPTNDGTTVPLSTATTTVPLTYDFWGFEQRYYEVTYPAPGAPHGAHGAQAYNLMNKAPVFERLALICYQIAQEFELLGRQPHRAALDEDFPAFEINFEVR